MRIGWLLSENMYSGSAQPVVKMEVVFQCGTETEMFSTIGWK